MGCRKARLRIWRRKATPNTYCPPSPSPSYSRTTKDCDARDRSGAADCGALQHWLGTRRRAGGTESSSGRHQGTRRAAAVAPSLDLQADADDDHVHRPSHHRRRSLFRHAADRLVADRGGAESQCLCRHRLVHELVLRPDHPVRLHLGADAPHAGRHPAPDLGHRARLRPARARVAGGGEPRRLDQPDRGDLDHRLSGHGRAALMVAGKMSTPLARVRGLGSAKSGTEHFWRQRLTAVANVPLTIGFVFIVVGLLGRNHAAVVQILGSPLVAVIMLLFIVSITTHMRIGMQVIIEDYVHDEGHKFFLLMANTFFAFAVGLASAFAILMLSFKV